MEFIIISSPCIGGLIKINLRSKKIEKLMSGNIRGICKNDNSIYYVNGDKNAIFSNGSELFSFNGNGSLHDLKYFEKNFYLMSTIERKMIKFDIDGKLISELSFDNSYWPNCCIIDPKTKNILVFLSAKRPYSNSKIVCLDENNNFLWEFNCLEGDEIHSPFLINDKLYWCRSNHNCVVSGSLSLHLCDIKKILTNNSGYTRGLYLTDTELFLGTSENRHAETSLCNSELNTGGVHYYSLENNKFILKHTFCLETKEVYDIIAYA